MEGKKGEGGWGFCLSGMLRLVLLFIFLSLLFRGVFRCVSFCLWMVGKSGPSFVVRLTTETLVCKSIRFVGNEWRGRRDTGKGEETKKKKQPRPNKNDVNRIYAAAPTPAKNRPSLAAAASAAVPQASLLDAKLPQHLLFSAVATT